MQLVLYDNPVAILPLASLQRLRVFPYVREARHNIRVHIPLEVFGVPHYLPNDPTGDGNVDHEYLLDRLLSEEAVQRLLQRKLFLE